MRMDRRLASVLLVTATLSGSAVAFVPAPAVAAVVTATPDTFANTVTSQQVVFNVGTTNATLYNLAGGPTVTLTGPGTGTDTYSDASATVNGSAGTVTATLNLAPSGLPAGPGTYAVKITDAISVPSDTSSVTVTNVQPVITATAGLQPGTTTPITITATSGNFAKGDVVSFAQGNTLAAGLSITGVTVGATSISGTLHAAADVTAGSYDVVVTDTAGNSATHADAVTVAAAPGAVTGLEASSISAHGATLSWTPAVTPMGGTPATGYTVIVSTSSTATKTDAGINVAHTGTDATAIVTGLKEATKYFATVTPTSAAGPGPATPPISFFTSEPSFLTFSHTKANVTYGSLLTLSGNLSTTDDAPLALQPIALWSKTGSAAAVHFKTVNTTADGNYSYTFKPLHNATYIAVYAGQKATSSSAAIGGAISSTFNGTVGQRITLTGTPKHHGQWLQLSGKVAPNATGRTVVIYQKSHGHLRRFTSARVRAGSTYKVVLKHVKSGRYKLYASIVATALNTAGKSEKLTVNRP